MEKKTCEKCTYAFAKVIVWNNMGPVNLCLMCDHNLPKIGAFHTGFVPTVTYLRLAHNK